MLADHWLQQLEIVTFMIVAKSFVIRELAASNLDILSMAGKPLPAIINR